MSGPANKAQAEPVELLAGQGIKEKAKRYNKRQQFEDTHLASSG